ncbi:MAG: hypothetical protein HC802_02230 [Caldilineaceae bacterium]|nr:hypothetical protein [Caldilineaceae bacterium]
MADDLRAAVLALIVNQDAAILHVVDDLLIALRFGIDIPSRQVAVMGAGSRRGTVVGNGRGCAKGNVNIPLRRKALLAPNRSLIAHVDEDDKRNQRYEDRGAANQQIIRLTTLFCIPLALCSAPA